VGNRAPVEPSNPEVESEDSMQRAAMMVRKMKMITRKTWKKMTMMRSKKRW